MNKHSETFIKLKYTCDNINRETYIVYNEILASFCEYDLENIIGVLLDGKRHLKNYNVRFKENMTIEELLDQVGFFERQTENENQHKFMITDKNGNKTDIKVADFLLKASLIFCNNEKYIIKILGFLVENTLKEENRVFNIWSKYIYYLINNKGNKIANKYFDYYNTIFTNSKEDDAKNYIQKEISTIYFITSKNNIKEICNIDLVGILKVINAIDDIEDFYSDDETLKTYEDKLKSIILTIDIAYYKLFTLFIGNNDFENKLNKMLLDFNLDDNVTDKDLEPIIDILKDSPIDELKTIENIEDILNKQGDTNGEECKKTPSKSQRRKTRKEKNKEYAERIATHNNNLDVNRKWGLLCTDKINSNLMNLRERITSQVEQSPKTIEDLENKIINLENKKNKNKDELDLLKDLKQERELKEEKKAITQKKLNELEEDKKELYSKLKSANYEESKNINKLIREIDKKIKNIKEDEEPLVLQGTLYDKYEIVKENKRTKEVYKLVVDVDYDIQNFNQEGRNFLYYVPNIPNVLDQLENDFITLNLEDYLAFFGRENGNISNIRKNLFNTLKEMRKESYEFTIKDDTHKGNFIKGSLVLIGDVILQTVNNKTTIAVQLGATFKQNIKNSILKGQLAYVNSDVWKSGKGQNKRENMAKELTFYFVKNARIEAKKLIKGEYFKDFYIKTIIDYLVELNLINYDTSRYNERVKEPLLSTLNLAEDMGFFKSETDAFKNYDNAINNTNNGKSNKNKIKDFENSKIRIILNNSTIDIEKMQKAHKTYNKHKNETTKK